MLSKFSLSVFSAMICLSASAFAGGVEGQTWVLTSPKLAISQKIPTMTLTAGQVTGIDGCNNYSSDYSIGSGSRIKIATKGFASTRMACPDMAKANRFQNLLSSATAYKITQNKLTLLNGKRKTIATFTAQ